MTGYEHIHLLHDNGKGAVRMIRSVDTTVSSIMLLLERATKTGVNNA